MNSLNKLKKEGKLSIVESSEEIKDSYLEKASDSLKSAKILLENDLRKNSIIQSYYAMYSSLTALLFKIGIKCENHTGSIMLLDKIFDSKKLFEIMSFAKKEREDKQYYVTQKQFKQIKESAEDVFSKAEDFLLEARMLIEKLTHEDILQYDKRIREILK